MQKKPKMNHKEGRINIVFLRYLLGCIALVLMYVGLRKGFSAENAAGLMQIWGDAFVITSVVMLEVVGVSWLNRHGYIDWVGYSLELSRYLLGRKKSDESFVNYYDYKTLRERNMTPLWPGIMVAVIWFLLGLILSLLFLSFTR
jgi:hypothetical protein